MRKQRSLKVALGAVSALLASLGGLMAASPAKASPAPADSGLPTGFSSWAAVFAVQNPLNAAGSAIAGVAAANPQSGYVNFSVDVATRSLKLYWHGRPSTAEQRAIDAVRARGIGVRLVAAAHSKLQLDAQAAAIAQDEGRTGALRLARITIATDGSGIRVAVFPTSTTKASRPASLATASPHLATALPHLATALAQGDVTMVTQTRPTAPYSREADLGPFWGGDLLTLHTDPSSGSSPVIKACSGGFAANWPSASNKKYLITAGHCGGIGSTWYNGSGSLVGNVEGRNNAYDASFINVTPHGGSDGHVYDGPPVWVSGQSDKPVAGAAHVGVGSYICTSGAVTGVACGGLVTSTSDSDCSITYLGCIKLVDAYDENKTPTILGEEGDSGGPVFTLTDGGAKDVAVGLIHGPVPGADTTTCPNPLAKPFGFPAWDTCSYHVSFTDVLDAMAPYKGLKITTG